MLKTLQKKKRSGIQMDGYFSNQDVRFKGEEAETS